MANRVDRTVARTSERRPTDQLLRREILRVLREQPTLDAATALAIVGTLRGVLGWTATPADARRVLPELGRISSFGTVDLTDEQAAVDVVESFLAVPENISNKFWSRCGMAVYPLVADLESGNRHEHVELHLLTDSKRDWWFTVPATNYAGGWELGPSTPASRTARRREFEDFVRQADMWLSEPVAVSTSLTRDDYQWLTQCAANEGLGVHHRSGRLKML